MSFRPHKEAVVRMESARRLVQLLLEAEDLYPAHRKQFVKLALWKITEAEGGKNNTRFRSVGSRKPNVKLQHEHVYERAKMADELLANPKRMDDILETAVGCIVTADEHEVLSRISKERPELSGWDRYRAAGIEWMDTLQHPD